MKYDLPDRNNKEKPPNYLIKCKGAVFQVLSSFLKFRFFLTVAAFQKQRLALPENGKESKGLCREWRSGAHSSHCKRQNIQQCYEYY